MRRARVRHTLGILGIATLAGLTLPMVVITGDAVSAVDSSAAATPLACTPGTIYNLTTTGGFYALNTSTGVDTPAMAGVLGAGQTLPNALGISTDGTIAYTANEYVTQSGSTDTTTVNATNVTTGATTSYTAMPAGGAAYIVAGAVDPVNGDYFYGGWDAANTEFTLSAFDPSTHTATEIGTITPGGTATYSSGDIAFDGTGDLYILAGASTSSALVEIDAATIAEAGGSALMNKVLATLTGSSATFDGIAFTANSELYAESGTGGMFEINPDSGVVTALATQSGIMSGDPDDLASCAYNATLQARGDIVGRVASADQFTITITGAGLSAGNTGTTTGTSTGLQTAPGQIAGPIVGLSGSSYLVSEAAAPGSGANLAHYATTYTCVNGTGSVEKGTGASFTLDFPVALTNTGAQVVCTFTNTPLPTVATTTITTTKLASTPTPAPPATAPLVAAPPTAARPTAAPPATTSLAFTGMGPGTWSMLAGGGVLFSLGTLGRRRFARRAARGSGG